MKKREVFVRSNLYMVISKSTCPVQAVGEMTVIDEATGTTERLDRRRRGTRGQSPTAR